MTNDTPDLSTLATDARDAAALAWDRLRTADARRLEALALGYSIAAQMRDHARPAIEAVAA
ncbi:hypothetical protein [Demequina sediminicola]|uniref:hypothetical protein n=1 Tax=Demequina sediminicola TaxID=1095026 RepID=UPI0007802CAB|nr:hypothetical protein [Demequina sediminicola]